MWIRFTLALVLSLVLLSRAVAAQSASSLPPSTDPTFVDRYKEASLLDRFKWHLVDQPNEIRKVEKQLFADDEKTTPAQKENHRKFWAGIWEQYHRTPTPIVLTKSERIAEILSRFDMSSESQLFVNQNTSYVCPTLSEYFSSNRRRERLASLILHRKSDCPLERLLPLYRLLDIGGRRERREVLRILWNDLYTVTPARRPLERRKERLCRDDLRSCRLVRAILRRFRQIHRIPRGMDVESLLFGERHWSPTEVADLCTSTEGRPAVRAALERVLQSGQWEDPSKLRVGVLEWQPSLEAAAHCMYESSNRDERELAYRWWIRVNHCHLKKGAVSLQREDCAAVPLDQLLETFRQTDESEKSLIAEVFGVMGKSADKALVAINEALSQDISPALQEKLLRAKRSIRPVRSFSSSPDRHQLIISGNRGVLKLSHPVIEGAQSDRVDVYQCLGTTPDCRTARSILLSNATISLRSQDDIEIEVDPNDVARLTALSKATHFVIRPVDSK
jgi:hypothetical protein